MALDLEMNGMQRIDGKYQVARMLGPYICTFLAGIIPNFDKSGSTPLPRSTYHSSHHPSSTEVSSIGQGFHSVCAAIGG